MNHRITLFACIAGATDLLPQFLDYYSRIGVQRFVFSVRHPTDGSQAEAPIVDGFRNRVFIHWQGPVPIQSDGEQDSTVINILREGFSGWHVIADLDEFHDFGRPLPMVIAEAEALEKTGVALRFIDRITEDGSLPAIEGNVDRQFPMACNATEYIGGNLQKVGLVRNDVQIGPGHHYCVGEVLQGPFYTHHFKWKHGCNSRLKERITRYRSINVPWITESEKALELMSSGKLDLTKLKTWRATPLFPEKYQF